MFLRRLFYDLTSGVIEQNYTIMSAKICPQTIEKDMQDFGLENCGCLEWTEYDEELEAKFNEGREVTVDINTREVVFGEIIEPVIEPNAVDQALIEMGVKVYE